jgi:hypothetical protein
MPSFYSQLSDLKAHGPVCEVWVAVSRSVEAALIAYEPPLKGQHIECLIGRDVLSSAVFVYTGINNSFTLSF